MSFVHTRMQIRAKSSFKLLLIGAGKDWLYTLSSIM